MGQRFHLPTALKRAKSNSQSQGYQPEAKDHKVQHLREITETDFNPVRNQSISSSATARLPTLSFSDATTELGSSIPPAEPRDPGGDILQKASSVLLHEEFLLKADGAGSIHSSRLKVQPSSSTLNSYYDPEKIPLSVSQQTSESSRRDFALRKGATTVLKSMTSDNDLFRQLKLFRLARNGDKSGTKKLAKAEPQSTGSGGKAVFGHQRSPKLQEQDAISGMPYSRQQYRPKKGVYFTPERSATTIRPRKSRSFATIPLRHDEPQVKVNTRRPKAGVKYWFDGLEGDSSDEESVHEPECQPSFVDGIEMAFEGGKIGVQRKDEARINSIGPVFKRSGQSTNSKVQMGHHLPPSAIPPRVSTLNTKSSMSALSQKDSRPTLPKAKATSLASIDLHKMSMLDLSSSDDDEPAPDGRVSIVVSLPRLRDSIAENYVAEADIEIGTAKTVDTRQYTAVQAAPSLRRVRGGQKRRNLRTSVEPPRLSPHRWSTYLSDPSSEPMQEDELLTRSPTLMTDQTPSHHPSLPDAFSSDSASIESRRFISVTKQEETLLASMRSQRTGLSHVYNIPTHPRMQAIPNMEGKPLQRRHHAPRSSGVFELQPSQQSRMAERVQSTYSDSTFDQASCATFQTRHPTNDPSIRYSTASFRSGSLFEPGSDMSSSMKNFLPAPDPRSNVAHNRMSRSSFFSNSTNSSQDNSRNQKESHYLGTLEKKQSAPRREEVSSQDFIDFPYDGWMKVALVH